MPSQRISVPDNVIHGLEELRQNLIDDARGRVDHPHIARAYATYSHAQLIDMSVSIALDATRKWEPPRS